MLHKIEIENFYSIKDREVLDFTISKNVPDSPENFVHAISDDSVRVSKVAALFGPNASGKSTVLRTIYFLRNYILGRIDWDENNAPYYLTFNAKEYFNKPTRLYAEFESNIINEDEICLYSYELILEPKKVNDNYTSIVKVEELRYKPKGRWRRIIKREYDNYIVNKVFGITNNDMRLSYVNSTSSVFHVLAKFNHSISENLINVLECVQTNITPLSFGLISVDDASNYYNSNETVFSNLKKTIRIMDLGIENVSIEKTDKGLKPRFKHKGHDIETGYEFESEGTKNFYCMFPYINYALLTGSLAVIDEIDRDIHPMLLPEIINWFRDPERNKSNAQLIISCHNASLLETLIKEEVFFTEKDPTGHTQIYALKDIAGVRRDMNIYSKYLGGHFGAIPSVG